MTWTSRSYWIKRCLGACAIWFLTSKQVAAARTIDVLALPVLTSLLEPPPTQSTLEHLGNDGNATISIKIPPSSMDQKLFITINVCSLSSSGRFPRILLTNATSLFAELQSASSDILDFLDQPETKAHAPEWDASGFADTKRANQVVEVLKGQYAWSIKLEENAGFANWTGWMGDGGLVVVFADRGDAVDVEVGIRLGAPIHTFSPEEPLLGDTTDSQALIMSPVLETLDSYRNVPTYPNYTLSSPLPEQLSLPPRDGLSLNESRMMYPLLLETGAWSRFSDNSTVADFSGRLSWSMCALKRAINQTTDFTGFNGGELSGLRPPQTSQTSASLVQRRLGWRWKWIVEGLAANGMNYTVWVVEDGGAFGRGTLYGPIYMSTKEDTFPCPLVHGLDICPSIAYAGAVNTTVTIPAASAHAPMLEPHILLTLEASLNAFSTSLLSSACGRDLFSPVSTCADCFDEYREWLCRSIIPRCASQEQVAASDNRQQIVESPGRLRDKIPMTRRRTRQSPRTPFSANPTYSFDELLPCMDNCRRVDRKCPVFLGFRCPLRGINANESYAYCGPEHEDRGVCEGEADGGSNRWGQTWCNGVLT